MSATIGALAAEWRQRAEMFAQHGAEGQAATLRLVAQELETRLDDFLNETLTVSQAADESGYSEEHLRRLVRENRIPDPRPDGSESEIRIRRCDLPRKPPPAEPAAVESLLEAVQG